MQEALRALTPRGRGFIAAGLTALLCGVLFGTRDLVRIGVLITLLPVLTAAWVARSGTRLSVSRTISAHQIETDQAATVELALTNLGPSTGVLLLEERLPRRLGDRPRFAIDAMAPGWRGQVDYRVSSAHRGKYAVGPLTLRIGDPLGMTDLQRPFTQTNTLVITPKVERLPTIPLRGAWAGSGDNRPRPFTLGNVADVTVRDYRLGDDLRRVHWPSTARTGDLMVRREERPWQSRCTLFIDNRARSHRGVAPDSSLEKAVVAAASIAVKLASEGYQVRLVSAQGEELGHGWHDGGIAVDARPLLERLAVLPTAGAEPLQADWADESVGNQLFVAVLGATDEHDLQVLNGLYAAGGASYAVVLAVGEWGAHGDDLAPPAATGWLQSRGWKAASLNRTAPVAQAWQGLSR